MYTSVERRMASTPSYGSYVSALNKKPPSKDTNRWVQSPHSSSSSSTQQPHQKQQPHLFHTTSNSSSSSSTQQGTGIHANTTTNPPTTIQSCDNGTNEYTSNQTHHQHQAQQQKNQSGMAECPTGFGMNAAMTGSTSVSVDDGGWSRGVPEKGSGWRNLSTSATTPMEGPSWSESGGGSGPSPDVGGSSGWGNDHGAANSSDKKSGSGWFSAESGANRPSSIGTDGWAGKPRHGPSHGNERGAWNKATKEGKTLDGCEKRGPESGMNGVSMWGANKTSRDMVGGNWGGPEDSARGDDRHGEYSLDTCSPPSEDSSNSMDPSGQRKAESDADRSSQSSNEIHGLSGQSQESYRGVNSSPAAFELSDSVSLGSSGGANSHGDYQSSGNFSGSRDSHVTGSDNADAHHGGFESPYSRISPRNGAGTPVQPGSRNGGATPTQGSKDRGDNFWAQGRVGSTSSISSVGSNSSWKSEAKNGGFQAGRRNSRFGSHQDDVSSGGHTPVSTHSLSTSNYGNSMGSAKGYPRKTKNKVAEYEEGLGSLQSAPSGWGELPSPKLSDLDNGTEFWGIPPDDLERQMRDKAKMNRTSTSSMPAGDMGWLDGSPPEVDWEEDMGGWSGGGGGGGPASGTLNQGHGSWGSFSKEKMAFADNLVQLMNMGMNRQNAEKLLSSTNNNLEVAMLIAAGEESAFDAMPSFSPRKGSSAKGSQSMISTPTYSSGGSTGMGLGQDLMMPLGSLQGMQGQMPPAQQQQQAKSQSQLKLLQMQQQYLLPGSAPNQPLKLQSYLQLLNQRYLKLQKNRQLLTQQLKMSGNDTSVAHQITLKLQRVQQTMMQIDQQRMVMAQLPNQQQDVGSGGTLKSQDPVALGSPMMSMAGNLPRGKAFGGGKLGSMGRSHSTSGVFEEGGMEGKGLAYNMQGLSLGASASQSSARSVSRFHQIFSNSSSESMLGLGTEDLASGGSQGSSPFSPPQGGGGSAFSARGGMGESASSASTPSGSTPFLPSGKPYSDIQEFRPGVPWQPRSQATEPAQLYSKQASALGGGSAAGMPYGGGGGGGGSGESYASVAPSPVFTNLPSPMLGSGGTPTQPNKSFTGGMGGPTPHKYMRSNSTGSGFYGTGGGFGTTKKAPLPSPTKYSQYPSRSDGIRQSLGQSGTGGGWGSGSSSNLLSEDAYGGMIARATYFNQSSHTSISPVSITSQLPPGTTSDRLSSWKASKPVSNGRRVAPPTSLPPRTKDTAKSVGAPLGTRELFESTPAEKNWASLGVTPGAMTPGLSNPVWGATPVKTPDDPSAALQNQWGKDEVSKIWNQTSEPDTFSSAPSKPPGLSVNPESSALYMKTPGEQSSTSEGANSFPSTPSFSSGSSTWGQDDIRSSDAQKGTLSPEPTFAEWQAGKKARLSAFKLPPSMASSPWLVIKNINTQIDTMFLRDVCCKYGTVRVCHTHYQSELALICFSSVDEAIQAKAGLDKDPTILGVPVSAQFASEANIKELCEQLQVGINSDHQHRGWSNDTPRSETMEGTAVSHATAISASAQWEGHTPVSTPFSRQTSEMSTWSDGGFLSGFSSSPWLSSGPVSSTSMGSGGNNAIGPSPQEPATISNFMLPGTGNGQSFLPGGLL